MTGLGQFTSFNFTHWFHCPVAPPIPCIFSFYFDQVCTPGDLQSSGSTHVKRNPPKIWHTNFAFNTIWKEMLRHSNNPALAYVICFSEIICLWSTAHDLPSLLWGDQSSVPIFFMKKNLNIFPYQGHAFPQYLGYVQFT